MPHKHNLLQSRAQAGKFAITPPRFKHLKQRCRRPAELQTAAIEQAVDLFFLARRLHSSPTSAVDATFFSSLRGDYTAILHQQTMPPTRQEDAESSATGACCFLQPEQHRWYFAGECHSDTSAASLSTAHSARSVRLPTASASLGIPPHRNNDRVANSGVHDSFSPASSSAAQPEPPFRPPGVEQHGTAELFQSWRG